MLSRGPVRGPGHPCKRCNQGNFRHRLVLSVQVVRVVQRAILLIIRRSWVRAPPAPRSQRCRLGYVTCGNAWSFVILPVSRMCGCVRPGAAKCRSLCPYVLKSKINIVQSRDRFPGDRRTGPRCQSSRSASLIRRLRVVHLSLAGCHSVRLRWASCHHCPGSPAGNWCERSASTAG
jgi:hypothetical protein